MDAIKLERAQIHFCRGGGCLSSLFTTTTTTGKMSLLLFFVLSDHPDSLSVSTVEPKNIQIYIEENTLRACLHGVGDPGLVGLVSFVFTLWGTQNKRNFPH